MFPRACLGEKRVKGIIPVAHGGVAGHLTIWMDAVLQTVELPAGVPHLHARLPYVDGYAFSLRTKTGELLQ